MLRLWAAVGEQRGYFNTGNSSARGQLTRFHKRAVVITQPSLRPCPKQPATLRQNVIILTRGPAHPKPRPFPSEPLCHCPFPICLFQRYGDGFWNKAQPSYTTHGQSELRKAGFLFSSNRDKGYKLNNTIVDTGQRHIT